MRDKDFLANALSWLLITYLRAQLEAHKIFKSRFLNELCSFDSQSLFITNLS